MVAAAVPAAPPQPTDPAPMPELDDTGDAAPDEEAARARSSRSSCVLIALIGVIGYLLLTQLGDGDGEAAAIEVADVVNQPVDAGHRVMLERQASRSGSSADGANQAANGIVVRQDPSAGDEGREGETVVLTVSDGAGSVKIPELSASGARRFEEAAEPRSAKRPERGRARTRRATRRAGEVHAHRPAAGQRRRQGTGARRSTCSCRPARAGQRARRRAARTRSTRRRHPDRRRLPGREGERAEQRRSPPGRVIGTDPAGGHAAPPRQRRHA